MAIRTPSIDAVAAALPAPHAGWVAVARDFARRRPLGAAGAVVVVLMIAAALTSTLIAPYDPLAVDFAAMLAAPSAAHWLGTDAFGRDVLSRLIYGSRTALLVGFGAAFFGATAGAILGVGSAYFAGRGGLYLQRPLDVFLSLLLLAAFLGQAILLEASLSFLGLGVQEPTAAWGLMLRGAAVDFAETAPWMAIFPGLAISLGVFAFNLFGDSLRDALDPKLRTL